MLNRPHAQLSQIEVQQALADLVQAYPYLADAHQTMMRDALCQSPLQASHELAPLWVEAAYGIAGPGAISALRSHSESPKSPAQSQSRAALYVNLLSLESSLSTEPPAEGAAPDNLHSVLPSSRPVTIEALSAHFAAGHPEGTLRSINPTSAACPILASDCDGTTWSGDIGEEFFDAAIEDGWFEPQSLPLFAGFHRRLDLPEPKSPTESARLLQQLHASGELVALGESKGIAKNDLLFELYELQGRAYVGKTLAEIKARTRVIFESHMATQIFPEIQELFELARAHTILPIAVSASCQWQVEVGASYLGVPPRLCLGVRSQVQNGVIGSTMNLPMTYGQGKVDALRTISGSSPLIAIGDSWQRTDKEMLHDAALGLVVVHDTPDDMPGLHAFHVKS